MRTRIWVVAVVLVAATAATLFALRPSEAAQDKEKPPRVKWDYKAVAEEKLSDAGEQGWEVIAVTGGQPYVESSAVHVPIVMVQGSPKETTTNKVKFAPIVYHLKRPK
jgi:hypothetical protein